MKKVPHVSVAVLCKVEVWTDISRDERNQWYYRIAYIGD